VNGAIAGPFADASPIDGRALLRTHSEFVEGMPILYINHRGCAASMPVLAARVRTDLPWIPNGTPPVPSGGQPVPANPANTIIGRPTPWICKHTPTPPGSSTGTCTCTSYYTIEFPNTAAGCPLPTARFITGRCLVYEEWTCTGTGCTAQQCSSQPNLIPQVQPNGTGGMSPTHPSAPPSGCSTGCTGPKYWYWS
jgi:hypothetical protein